MKDAEKFSPHSVLKLTQISFIWCGRTLAVGTISFSEPLLSKDLGLIWEANKKLWFSLWSCTLKKRFCSPALILHHVRVFYLLSIFFCSLFFQSILKSSIVFVYDNIASSIEWGWYLGKASHKALFLILFLYIPPLSRILKFQALVSLGWIGAV